MKRKIKKRRQRQKQAKWPAPLGKQETQAPSAPATAQAYAIRHWDRFYENAQSRRTKVLPYAFIPHDGFRGAYEHLEAHPDRCIALAVWHCLLIEASKCPQRGLFADFGGPLSLEQLAKRINFDVPTLERALNALMAPGIHLVAKVSCPKHLILSGRSTRKARQKIRARELLELDDIEHGPELHFEPIRTVVDHDGKPEIETYLPDHIPVVDHTSQEEQVAEKEQVEESSKSEPSVVDHTSTPPKSPPKKKPNISPKTQEILQQIDACCAQVDAHIANAEKKAPKTSETPQNQAPKEDPLELSPDKLQEFEAFVLQLDASLKKEGKSMQDLGL